MHWNGSMASSISLMILCYSAKMKRNMHDDNLRNPMKRPTKSKVSSNIDKYEIKRSVTAFFINLYSAIGILPDLKKIKCIHNMPAHKNWEECNSIHSTNCRQSLRYETPVEKGHAMNLATSAQKKEVWSPQGETTTSSAWSSVVFLVQNSQPIAFG